MRFPKALLIAAMLTCGADPAPVLAGAAVGALIGGAMELLFGG